jgi:death on curing protein
VSELQYLTLEDALELIRELKVGPVRDVGLLDSAIARPRSSAFGHDAYESIELKASALLDSLANNHSLVDGNKRLAWLAVTVFLKINGFICDLEDDQAFALVWDVAAGKVSIDVVSQKLRVIRA